MIVVGDYNAKLKSNLQYVFQNGKQLERVINSFYMKVANEVSIYHGLWTRVNNKNSSEISFIDYLLLSEKLGPYLTNLLIEVTK